MSQIQKGFTLVELMITMVIVLIVVSIAAVAYNDYSATARMAAMHQKIDALRIFQENFRIDNGTYREGTYEPGVVNDFAAIGYVQRADDDGIKLVVTDCNPVPIEDCFQVTATNANGEQVIWRDGQFL